MSKFEEMESRHDWRSRTCKIWVNMDAVMFVAEYPKYYRIQLAEGHTQIEKTEHNRTILSRYGVKVNE